MIMPTRSKVPPTNRRARRCAAFTLIELLIVIAILGLLVVAFLPDLVGAKQHAAEVTTQANLTRLGNGCESIERRNGFYPPDDFVDPAGKLQFKADNGVNTGIESLVAFLSQSAADGADLTDLGPKLTNTDKDENGAPLPLLGGRTDRPEVADEWLTPLAYFAKGSLAADKPQVVAPGGDDAQRLTAKPRRGAD